MRYLLDTCMLVALLQRELGSERIREKILLAPSGSLAISAISAAEIWRGIGQSRCSQQRCASSRRKARSSTPPLPPT